MNTHKKDIDRLLEETLEISLFDVLWGLNELDSTTREKVREKLEAYLAGLELSPESAEPALYARELLNFLA